MIIMNRKASKMNGLGMMIQYVLIHLAFSLFLHAPVLCLESCAIEVPYQFQLYLVYVCFLIYFANKVLNFFPHRLVIFDFLTL